MQAALLKLVVTGGCPLQRAALSDWLLTHGFGVADHFDSPDGDCAPIALFLCSEHDPHLELTALASKYPSSRTIAILSCNCERALSIVRCHGLLNVFCADEPPERLADAIHAVHSGQQYRSPSFEQFLARGQSAEHVGSSSHRLLTPREFDVLRLLAQGLSKKRIAESLHLSVKTVDNHSTSIMSKLNIHNRVDLARYAIREGLATA